MSKTDAEEHRLRYRSLVRGGAIMPLSSERNRAEHDARDAVYREHERGTVSVLASTLLWYEAEIARLRAALENKR